MVAVTLPENPADLARYIAVLATPQLHEARDEWEQHAAEYEVFDEAAKLMWAREVLRLLDLEIAKRAGDQDPTTHPKARHFAVTTQRGTINFTSTLTDSEALAVCGRLAMQGDEFAYKLVNTKRKLSDLQVAWTHKLALDADKPKPAPSMSEWMGTVGGKIELVAVIKSAIERQGGRGEQTIVKLLAGTNELTWFASGWGLGFVEGQTVNLSATVRAHDTFRGTKQTILTRVKKI
jgi:hypothetical protein